MKLKPQFRHNKYQIAMRIIVVAALVFFISLSFGLEILWNGIR